MGEGLGGGAGGREQGRRAAGRRLHVRTSPRAPRGAAALDPDRLSVGVKQALEPLMRAG